MSEWGMYTCMSPILCFCVWFFWNLYGRIFKNKLNKHRCAPVICQHWDFKIREWSWTYLVGAQVDLTDFYLLILGLGKGVPMNSNLGTCQMIRGEIPALLEQSQSSTASWKPLAPLCWATMSLGASLRTLVHTDKAKMWKAKKIGKQPRKSPRPLIDRWHVRSWEPRLNFLPFFSQRTRIKVLKEPDIPSECALSKVTSKLEWEIAWIVNISTECQRPPELQGYVAQPSHFERKENEALKQWRSPPVLVIIIS